MTKRLSAIVIALLAGAFVPTHSTPKTTPLPGPGGVAMALMAFLKHQDDGTSAAALLVDRRGNDFTIGEGGRLQEVKGAAAISAFMDVAGPGEGRPVSARKAGEFAAVLGLHVSANKQAKRTLRTAVHAIRASCDSERCSLAIVEFDPHQHETREKHSSREPADISRSQQ